VRAGIFSDLVGVVMSVWTLSGRVLIAIQQGGGRTQGARGEQASAADFSQWCSGAVVLAVLQ